MAEKTKRCTACGGDMHLRLGIYECAQCGLTEEVQAAPPPATHGPGLKRPQPWQSQSSGTSSGSGGTIYGQSGYGGPAPPPEHVPAFLAPPEGIYDTPERRVETDNLDTEKKVFFGILVLIALAYPLMMLAIPAMAGINVPIMLGGNMFIGALFRAAVQLALYALALFYGVVWIKYTCMGCQVIGVLVIGWGLVFILGHPMPSEIPSALSFLVTIIIVGQILLNLWLISILYRDAQRLQGN